MPVGTQTPKLASSFVRIFDPETAPLTTPDAARVWARAYTDYALAGGIPDARTRESAFAAALTQAFNPSLAGGGPPLFIQALSVFWLGLAVPEQGGVVIAVTPTGSVNSPQPDNATIQQQASGLAQVISAFTLSSVKVNILPSGPVVSLL